MAGSGKRFGEQVATYAVGQAVSFPLNLLFDVLIARALGPAMRGQWFLIIAAVTLLANLLSLGIPAFAVYRLGKEPAAAGLLNVVVLTYAGILAAFGAALGLLSSNAGLNLPILGLVIPQGYAIAAVLAAVELYIICSTGLLTGLGHVQTLSRVNVATAAITVLVGAGPLFVLPVSAVGALTSYLVARLIAATLIARAVGVSRQGSEHRWRPVVRDMLHFGVAGQLGNFAVLTYQRVNVFLLGSIVGPQSLGYYSVAESLATRLAVLVGPLQVAFAVPISAADQRAAARWTAQLVRIATLLLVSVGVSLVALAAPLLRSLYGADYPPAAAVFRLLLPASALTTVASLVALFFSGHAGRPMINSVVSLTTMAISIPLSYVLVRNFGMTGAAWSALISGVIIFALVYGLFVVRNRLAIGVGLIPQRMDWEVLRDFGRTIFRVRRPRGLGES